MFSRQIRNARSQHWRGGGRYVLYFYVFPVPCFVKPRPAPTRLRFQELTTIIGGVCEALVRESEGAAQVYPLQMCRGYLFSEVRS